MVRRSTPDTSRIAGRARRPSTKAPLTIEAGGRWDALELVRRLPPCCGYLVEYDDRHWRLEITRAPAGRNGLGRLLETAESWAAERGIDAPVR